MGRIEIDIVQPRIQGSHTFCIFLTYSALKQNTLLHYTNRLAGKKRRLLFWSICCLMFLSVLRIFCANYFHVYLNYINNSFQYFQISPYLTIRWFRCHMTLTIGVNAVCEQLTFSLEYIIRNNFDKGVVVSKNWFSKSFKFAHRNEINLLNIFCKIT